MCDLLKVRTRPGTKISWCLDIIAVSVQGGHCPPITVEVVYVVEDQLGLNVRGGRGCNEARLKWNDAFRNR